MVTRLFSCWWIRYVTHVLGSASYDYKTYACHKYGLAHPRNWECQKKSYTRYEEDMHAQKDFEYYTSLSACWGFLIRATEMLQLAGQSLSFFITWNLSLPYHQFYIQCSWFWSLLQVQSYVKRRKILSNDSTV